MSNPALFHSDFDNARTGDATHHIAQSATIGVTVYHSIRQAEAIWRHLETSGVATAFQRFDWLRAWQRHIGARQDAEPRIVSVTQENKPVLVLPLGLFHENGIRVLRFLGGTHSNYNLGVFDRDFMIRADRSTMRQLMSEMIDAVGRIDVLELRNQPDTWMGLRNPLSLLPHQSAASNAYATQLQPDFEAFMKAHRGSKGRKKLRWQERAFDKVGGYTFKRVETAEEGHRVLAAFAEQKAMRFKAQGIHNVFADPGVMDFLHDLVSQSATQTDRPALEFFYLSAGGKIRATFAGSESGQRFSGFFNSISTDDLTRLSPGELLLTRVLQCICERDLAMFDLGCGEARYKSAWCDRQESLFDLLRGLTLAGKTAVAVKRTKLAAKRQIKQNERLWAVAKQMRQAMFGENSLPHHGADGISDTAKKAS